MKILGLVSIFSLLCACHPVSQSTLKQDQLCQGIIHNYFFLQGIDRLNLNTTKIDTSHVAQQYIDYQYQIKNADPDHFIHKKTDQVNIRCTFTSTNLILTFSYPYFQKDKYTIQLDLLP
ncbi:hypothetical protein F4V57_02260 [Acinetobacter qingfengensis]|uniref:Lipoprotein n=1 Tax=Acinetobacter qingfengensis TaxID=1262585 RepID=A0A1E7REW7_9GAMM|nr:hypothetical protein [Acinetobacter qingfengensis]KAA8735637.1 hypothetical protein F4V57_02260 [Acinetobacter qingfengensis]OEY97914.1 hypothetical protein BJI46_07560 [Acinetobacter qingfengensis]